MSKIVCDVCGTSYAESATQCPICGCVRPSDSVVVSAEPQEGETVRNEGYTYVKGGRFSRSNVKRRHTGAVVERESGKRNVEEPEEPKRDKGDKGLIVAVCMLLLAIAAVVIYIVIHFFGQQPAIQDPEPNNTSVVQPSSSDATTLATEADILCTGVILSETTVELDIAATHQLVVTLTPADTTDVVVYKSGDEAIATVSADGVITAVATGEATITVTCGEISAECLVICKTPETPTEATNPASPYTGPYKLNKRTSDDPKYGDVSIKVGESFQLKLLDANDNVIPVTWTVSSSSICSVNGNVVKGTEVGRTKISVTYEGETYTCLVRVREAS